MSKKILLITILNLIITTVSYAAESHYAIIVDAGSTGSRIHLYKHNNDKNLPDIQDIFNKKSDTPLASYAAHPESASESLIPLINDVITKLQDENVNEKVPLHLLGTAGMRLLTLEQQDAIYDSVRNTIQTQYKTLIPEEIHTISGKMEGLYDWLGVNYLTDSFKNNKPTAGTIDVGGGSIQIAFATNNKLKSPVDETSVHINGHDYVVFSKSFLGLGLDMARDSMHTDAHAANCYPKNAPYLQQKSGQFNLVNCRSVYHQLIESYQIEKQVPSVYKVSSFIAFSGAYHTYHFFGVDPNPPDQETLEQSKLNPICGHSWSVLKEAYPYETEYYLLNYCANGIYLTDLLYSGLQIQSKQLNVYTKINEQRIDWTLGSMLYILTSSPTS